jgi:hypothetical protein
MRRNKQFQGDMKMSNENERCETEELRGEDGENRRHEDHHHPHLVAIEIDHKAKEIETGWHEVAQIKKLGEVALADELDEVRDGKLVPLHDDGKFEIKGGEIFESQPRHGGSS